MKRSLLFITLSLACVLPIQAQARTFQIPNGNYAQLREAVRDANDTTQPDAIVLAADGNYKPSGDLTLPTITTHIRIYGQGATIDGANASAGRFVTVADDGNLVLADLNIVGVGYTSNEPFLTGGVIDNRGLARIRNVTIADTRIRNPDNATFGVAIANTGTLTLSNVTLSGNRGNGIISGGGLYNTGSASLENVTVIGNGHLDGESIAAGIDNTGGQSLVLASSIIAGNPGMDCVGPVMSLGGNIDSDGSCNLDQSSDQSNTDAELQGLSDNGSGILTHAFPAGSPARNAGRNVVCTVMDARGVPRPQAGGVDVGGRCDAGAYEYRGNARAFSNKITGTWFDPQQSGHGFMVEILPPGNRILMTWFVYDAAGNSDWVQATGEIDEGVAKLTAYRLTGGAFPPVFDPDQTQVQYWGTLSMVVESCTRGAIAWAPDVPGYIPGGMKLGRVTQVAGLQCS